MKNLNGIEDNELRLVKKTYWMLSGVLAVTIMTICYLCYTLFLHK